MSVLRWSKRWLLCIGFNFVAAYIKMVLKQMLGYVIFNRIFQLFIIIKETPKGQSITT